MKDEYHYLIWGIMIGLIIGLPIGVFVFGNC